ncbi:MAG: hypothetical protein ABSC05_39255 [Candidatus Solibacter sp.]|jgi:hypothetical protein
MIPNKVAAIIFIGLLGAALALADSVTWIDRTSNGTPTDRTLKGVIEEMSEGKLKLEARFTEGRKMKYEIPIDQVRRIEFNPQFVNPPAPSQVSALGGGPKAPPPAKRALVAYAVELRGSGGELEPCKVMSIDEKTIRCEAQGKSNPKEYPRSLVLRILVRGDQ